MKRQTLVLLTLAVAIVGVQVNWADAAPRGGRGGGGRGAVNARGDVRGVGHSRGFGARGVGFQQGCNDMGFGGIGFGGFYGGWDIGALYRQLYNNLPYFALHPPVYYSYPVPRPYGYSPFAYMPGVMTPEVSMGPLEIINPHVPSTQNNEMPAKPTDTTAAAARQPEPLVIINPYVTTEKALAKSAK